MLKTIEKVLRFGEGKKLRELQQTVAEVSSLEPEMQALSDSELRFKTAEFKERLENGETIDELMPEAFAVAREAAVRTLGLRPFDVQVMGAIVLHQGKISEMKTGEGKTLVATMPVYLNALTGKGVHIVTVNDYLAKRDSEWMGEIYRFLGLNVGLIQNQDGTAERVDTYKADLTYGTNNEFGFDYLRDNMVTAMEDKVQRGHHYAIVDEVDSILIDEARTPLIISGPAEQAASTYYQFARIVPTLKPGQDYEVDEKLRTVAVTEQGVARVEKMTGIDNLYDHVNSQLINHLNQALRAHTLFKRDVDYMIKDGEVLIVDEFTGRLLPGRRYSEGLHQAIEAKEGAKIQEENQTLATITLQNYFRLYEKLAGMTGTAATEADEFMHIYKLETVVVPTHKEMIRADMDDQIYRTEVGKFKAAVKDIVERHQKGQPILVGTISIEKSELLSDHLRKRGIKHEVLNAKHHEREAHIIAMAGQEGAVTIATNMAGRGVDIVLGEGVVASGGLHVLGTERHESRRIDNQLRGRSGRQGDPGSSQFYISLDDDLMRLFGSDRLKSVMSRLGIDEDMPIEHPLVNKSIETAQRQVESQNFEIRKRVLEYDDVMNKQREVIYAQRNEILEEGDLHEQAIRMIEEVVEKITDSFANKGYPEDWDLNSLFNYVGQIFPLTFGVQDIDIGNLTAEELKDALIEDALNAYEQRENELGPELLREMERFVLLQIIDGRWREHLYEMDYLREGIGLRAIGQKDPLVEYKAEGFAMFQEMIESMKDDFVRYIFHVQMVEMEVPREDPAVYATSGGDSQALQVRRSSTKTGRNDPCPCGSGKKFKKCCGL